MPWRPSLVALLATLASGSVIQVAKYAEGCTASTHGGGDCTAVYLPKDQALCELHANTSCQLAHDEFVDAVQGSCPGDANVQNNSEGFPWGIMVSIVADIIISVGLALQKVAHNRIKRKFEEMPKDAKYPPMTSEPVWWLGILLTVGGEIGNFLAYGDPSTPATVVTAVGCVGVISNMFISVLFLGEPGRVRDVIGAAFVITGVIIISFFAPQQAYKLTNERFICLLGQPGAIFIIIVLGVAICTLYFLAPKLGHKHVVVYLSMASLLGSVTVLSSKTVAALVGLSFSAAFDPSIPFSNQVDLGITDSVTCIDAGFNWKPLSALSSEKFCVTVQPFSDAIRDDEGEIIKKGLQQFGQWPLWVCLIFLVATALTQVKYINEGMKNFGNSEVIPVHYVTFVLYSGISTMIFYQEFSSDNLFHLHLFIDGILCTFVGVYLITSNRKSEQSGIEGEGDGKKLLTGAKSDDEERLNYTSAIPSQASSQRHSIAEGVESVLSSLGGLSGAAVTQRKSVILTQSATQIKDESLVAQRKASVPQSPGLAPAAIPPTIDETDEENAASAKI